MLFFLAWLSSATFALSSADLETAIQFPVEKYQLKNGLTVLLHPDKSIPAVSVQTWFRVGSKDEMVGRTGLAHFFEHMMFKGTKRYPVDTWGKFLNGKGADKNAFTSMDYTGYYINAPSESLELLLDIESDRMRNLLLNPTDVTKEREVVKEERRMRYDDSIEGGMREKMSEVMFSQLPYRWLPIGSIKDLNDASMEDLHKFYKTFYSPNNAVLVVAGAFDMGRIKKLIAKYYDPLPREEIQRPVITPEAEQKEMRVVSIDREAQAPVVGIGYRLPDMKHPDHYALDLLQIILGQGQSSRLYKDLVYKRQLATSSYAYSWGQTLAGQFVIGASLKPKQSPEQVYQLIENQVKEIRDKGVSEKELEKARNIFLKDYVDGLKKVSGRAGILASYETLFGDYSKIFSDLKNYQKVTTQDLQRVAKSYLQPEKRNIVIVQPRQSKGRT